MCALGASNGFSGAHAFRAALTVGFEVSIALGRVVPVAPLVSDSEPLPGNETP